MLWIFIFNENICKTLSCMHGWGLSHVQLFVIPCTVVHHGPLSVSFSRKESWSRLLFPTPEDLPDQGIQSVSPALSEGFFITEPCGKLKTPLGSE